MQRDTSAAQRYHDATKHSVARLQAHQHYLDWEIKPLPFKIYPQLEPLPLPRDLPPSSLPALEAIALSVDAGDAPRVPDLTAVARVLHLAAGITHTKVFPGGEEYHFRAAACTGALYHIDLYVICGDLPGLPAGVYHFGPHDFSLYRLRSGDHRGAVVDASGGEPSIQQAPVVIACASTYWRNSWKYQSRAYRHCFWDCGTILANLLAGTAATLPTRIVSGFVDERVTQLLGLDPQREGPLALVALGHELDAVAPTAQPAPPLRLATVPLSTREVDYPAIRAMQDASALHSADEVRAWRDTAAASDTTVREGQGVALQPLAPAALPSDCIDRVITRRGSTRQFAPVPITFSQLSTMLACATTAVPADYGSSVNDLYLIVNAVEDLRAGTYVYHRKTATLELLRAGDFRREASHLGLGQDLPADASMNVYLLCDLEPVLARYGNRGYRVAQLDAAITGGKLYLAAYALRLGATGLTFFDDDVTQFFSPHAAGKSVMFLMAIGRGRKAAR